MPNERQTESEIWLKHRLTTIFAPPVVLRLVATLFFHLLATFFAGSFFDDLLMTTSRLLVLLPANMTLDVSTSPFYRLIMTQDIYTLLTGR